MEDLVKWFQNLNILGKVKARCRQAKTILCRKLK